MTRNELDPWIEGYLSYLADVRRMNGRTIIDIRCTLKRVGTRMLAHRPQTPLWKLSLEDYLWWLARERDAGSARSVMAKQLSHVRGLLEYTWRSGRSDRNVLDGFALNDRVPKSKARALTLQEAQQLVDACAGGSKPQRRARMVILLLYGCGLRTSELRGLDVQDVDVERQEIKVRHGKGGLQRTVPVPGAVWTELLAYLAERQARRGPLLRTQEKGVRISVKEAAAIVKGTAARAGIAGAVTPRTLRHTFGTHLTDRGVDIAVIGSLMGHRTPQESNAYLHGLPGRMEAAVESLTEEKEEA